MHSQAQVRQPRIPEQQSVGQTLPPVPVGMDTSNAPPLPPGAMPSGSRVQVQKYQVIIHNFLAEGGYAHVYIARIEGKSGYVVLKRVAVPDNERLRTIEKEIAFMRRLGDHKNIVRYYASRVDPMPNGGYEAFILMEYCPGGGVIDLMNRRLQQRLTEPEILKIFGDVCEALAYLHYCNPPVLHRDLKVENILILTQNHYKLCDFGSASLSKGQYVPSSLQEIQTVEDDIQRHTTLQYRAPEMIDIYQKKPINEKADIWALGVLLYKLCYYTTPFEEQGQLAILNARYSIPTQPHFSDGVKRLIMSMLQENQNQRPNIYQVVKAVSQLRGVECPIRNIYQEAPSSYTSQPTLSSRSSPVQHTVTSTTSSASDSPSSIFEKLPPQPHQLPEITPMRRGRPNRHSKTPSQNINQFDPFSPSQTSEPVKETDIDDAFGIQAKNQLTGNDDQNSNKARNSMLAFESDFLPTKKEENGGHHSRSVSNASESSTRNDNSNTVSTPKVATATTTGQDDEDLKFRNGVASDIEARLQRLKMSVERPNTPSSTGKLEEKISNGSGASPLLSSTPPPMATSAPPSSAISSPPVIPTRSTSTKPPPPPKPARLRASKQQPVSSSSPAGNQHLAPPTKPARSEQRLQRQPSLSDFEQKFPAIEDIYKNFSTATTNDTQHK
ncbi:hypothetical protein LRAMOSA03777 [Lichtheimia ramosa]|uniref:non-specific serine/threonine protein kinase n=1 Tax=Lichtheimia ramosa TaxID=688394 RepID=A0A077WWF2_9FUNG|nr:hypothetical protein LRAMOSA03777 [Lichtheimia ramosa]